MKEAKTVEFDGIKPEAAPCNQSEFIETLGSDIAGRPDMTTIKIAKLKMLAKAVLKAHKGQGCHGGEYDCCKCSACNEARLILGA